jgi:hypothetical protein
LGESYSRISPAIWILGAFPFVLGCILLHDGIRIV